ncbi:MAG: zinc ribbon domain-containing protein [Prevotellaceae bacterium]|jgi:uncharacterized membrane protein YvbJ|nr:zinc ribbon domain-containing protein [Prevotellaceae bacterium]
MICPNCEKEIANSIAQCPYCGCQFAVKEIPKPAPPPVVTEQPKPQEVSQNENKLRATEKNCPHCGKAIAENAVFCKWCGLSIEQQQNTATSETPSGAKFCKNCGKATIAAAAFCKWCGAHNSNS